MTKTKSLTVVEEAVAKLNPYDLIEQVENGRAAEMELFTGAFDQVWAHTQTLPQEQGEVIRQALQTMWQRLVSSNELVDAMGVRMKRQDAVIAGLDAAVKESARQRDAIADAFADHLITVENGDHPTVQKHIDKAVQDAFERFQTQHRLLLDLGQKMRWPRSDKDAS